MDEKLLGKKIPFYQDYIAKTERNDPYWKNSFWEILRNVPAKINVPVCIAEGWNDHNVEGVMVGVKGLRPEIREQSMIAIGAWDHFGMLPGELEYPDAMKHGHQHVKLMFGWLERMLKGKGKDSPPVSEVYVLGEGKWHDLTGWPPKTEKVAYYPGSGKTFMAVPANAGRETYLYDPENPVATVGGNALLAWMGGLGDADHGPMLQPDYADRNDVLMFKSEPLNETLTIMGGVEVFLEVSTSAPDTAFMVKLNEEFADGRTINIVDGASSILLRNESEKILDYSPGEKVVLKIRLWDVAWQVQKGSRLRFDVTSSNFPMYHIHSNRAGIWSAQEGWDKAEQTVFFGNDSSVVYLPVWKN
jgi:putative CocE/NonD family hydrolase